MKKLKKAREKEEKEKEKAKVSTEFRITSASGCINLFFNITSGCINPIYISLLLMNDVHSLMVFSVNGRPKNVVLSSLIHISLFID